MRAARTDAKVLASKSPSQTPRFSYLLRFGLESIGVHYVSVDLLRKAKKNQITEREYWALWRLLHDLVLVILADFDVDVEEMKKINDDRTLESALLDPEQHDIHVELVQFYLYDWGFVCTSFYSESRPSSQVLLLAIAWLLAFSRFFKKQHQYILERVTGCKQLHLPPFPHDVDLDAECIAKAATEAVSSTIQPCDKKLPLDGQMHQLHRAFGRLQSHLNALQAYIRYHKRLLKRLEKMQDKPSDEIIPAYVLNLLAGPTSRLVDQIRVLSHSVQLIEDEALFYKWINGLVLSLNRGDVSSSHTNPILPNDSSSHVALRAQIQEAQGLFQAHAESFQQIEQGYKQALKKWNSGQKPRSRAQMEQKVERFTNEVQTRELFDPQKLFLRSQRSWEALNLYHSKNGKKQVYLATKEEVERLQTQVATVIKEITREYCELQLR